MKLNFVTEYDILKLSYEQPINFAWQEDWDLLPKKAKTQKSMSPALWLAVDDEIKKHNAKFGNMAHQHIVLFSGQKYSWHDMHALRSVSQFVDEGDIDLINRTFRLPRVEQPDFRFYIKYDNSNYYPRVFSSVKHGSPFQIKLYIRMEDLTKIEWEKV